MEHGFWASERLLTGSSRSTIQPAIVNFWTDPFASVPRRRYRTTGIHSLSLPSLTSDGFSNNLQVSDDDRGLAVVWDVLMAASGRPEGIEDGAVTCRGSAPRSGLSVTARALLPFPMIPSIPTHAPLLVISPQLMPNSRLSSVISRVSVPWDLTSSVSI